MAAMTEVSAVDAYYAALPADQRALLERMRAQVVGLVPDAVEAISYGMPTFKLNGRAVVWLAGWKAHCAIYPLTDAFLEAHAEELKGYRLTKGSVHFSPEMPLPVALVERLVRERVADVEAGRG